MEERAGERGRGEARARARARTRTAKGVWVSPTILSCVWQAGGGSKQEKEACQGRCRSRARGGGWLCERI